MYARVTRTKADPARADELTKQLKSTMIPVFEQQPGYLGTISSANRETGDGATTTYWDTLENLQASEAAIFAARDKFVSEQGAQIVSVHRLEIAVLERSAEPQAGGHVRAIHITGMDPSKIDESISQFRERTAPLAKQQPGFRAAVLMVDREQNEALAVTAWDSPEHREASLAALLPQREAAVSSVGGTVKEVMNAETLYADLRAPVSR